MSPVHVVITTAIVTLLSGVVSYFLAEALAGLFGRRTPPVVALIFAVAFALLVGSLTFAAQQSSVRENSGGVFPSGDPNGRVDTERPSDMPVTQNEKFAGGEAEAEGASAPSSGSSHSISLLELNHVEFDANIDIDLGTVDNLAVNGQVVGPSLTYYCHTMCHGSSPQVRQYVLGKQYSRFSARLLVLDSSADVHSVEFYDGDSLVASYSVAPGDEERVDIDVRDVSRLSVAFYSPWPLRDAVQTGLDMVQGESGGDLPGVALVEPTLFP